MNLTATLDKEELSDGSPIYVSWCRELDIASQGETPREALGNLGEAVALFLNGASNEEIGRRFRQYLAMPELIAQSVPSAAPSPLSLSLAAAGVGV